MTLPAFLNAANVSHAIELALAPVLLLIGISGFVAVMTERLARVVDRGRHLTEGVASLEQRGSQAVQRELKNLERRRRLTSAGIAMATVSALLLCTVIVVLFLEALMQLQLAVLVGLLFACSTCAMVVGLIYLLTEIQLSSRSVAIAMEAHRVRVAASRADAETQPAPSQDQR